jgi:hypothetical protein
MASIGRSLTVTALLSNTVRVWFTVNPMVSFPLCTAATYAAIPFER